MGIVVCGDGAGRKGTGTEREMRVSRCVRRLQRVGTFWLHWSFHIHERTCFYVIN